MWAAHARPVPPPPPPAPVAGVEEEPTPEQAKEAIDAAWQYVYQNEPQPYYWNTVTGATTFDIEETSLTQRGARMPSAMLDSVSEIAAQAASEPPASAWVYVSENEETPYYWNTETNETTLSIAETDLTDSEVVFGANVGTADAPADGESVCEWWIEVASDVEGEVQYMNVTTQDIIDFRPDGNVVVVVEDETGETVNWQEFLYNDADVEFDGGMLTAGMIYYQNALTNEITVERPAGSVMIVTEQAA